MNKKVAYKKMLQCTNKLWIVDLADTETKVNIELGKNKL